MKKILFLTAMFCLLAISAFAQDKKTDFSGSWTLDVNKSKLDERMRVESMTMNVTQTDKEIKIETTIKRAPRPEGTGGGMGRGGFGGGDGTITYSLDGKETVIQQETPMGQIPVTLKAKFESDGKLKLNSSRTFSGQMGEISITTKETWLLSDGGTLTVKRDMETPRGTNSSELAFTKNNPAIISADAASVTDSSGLTQKPKQISGGVLNGKALQLVKPTYPTEAREAKASGAVNVQVTIDEEGNVISAKAVSGDVLLREASEDAARKSKFSPTLLEGVPVKVSGVIVYNFVP